jgi:hypothetical protein
MAYWGALSIILACVIAWATFSTSRRNYWISVFCFTGLAIGACFFAVFPMMIGINMANAFGPRSVSLLVYVGPLLTAGWFAYSALSLYPFLAGRAGFWIVTSITGLTVLYSLGLFVSSAIRFPMTQGPPPYLGIQAIYHWLLWMRVYELGKAPNLSQANSKIQAEQFAAEQPAKSTSIS